MLQGLSKVSLALAEWLKNGEGCVPNRQAAQALVPKPLRDGAYNVVAKDASQRSNTSLGSSVFEFDSAEPLPCPRSANGAEAKTGR